MNGNEFMKIVEIIRGAFPHMDRFKDNDVKDVWFECLEDLEFGKARTATLNAIKKAREFPPSIADIRAEYDILDEKDKAVLREIRQSYEHIKSYYPGSGGANYGWAEWQERCDSPEKAKRLRTSLYNYVREVEQTGGNTEPFAEKIKTIAIGG